jgi:hypothetical protein
MGEKTLQEHGEEYYCIFCLDDDGKPRKVNSVRKSIMNFWHERNSKEKDSS